MAERIFHINGQVINQHSGQGLPGLRVEAWDKDRRFDNPLSQTVSGREGVLEIRFDIRALRDDPAGQGPDLYFKVFNGAALLHSTEDAVMWDLAASF